MTGKAFTINLALLTVMGLKLLIGGVHRHSNDDCDSLGTVGGAHVAALAGCSHAEACGDHDADAEGTSSEDVVGIEHEPVLAPLPVTFGKCPICDELAKVFQSLQSAEGAWGTVTLLNTFKIRSTVRTVFLSTWPPSFSRPPPSLCC